MKAFYTSDNTDTQIGLRLAGIESVVLHEKNEIIEKINALIADPTIRIILLTSKVVHTSVQKLYLNIS